MQLTKKIAAAVLFLIILSSAYTNDRLQSFVKKYMSQNNESVASAVAAILEERTGIKIEREAMIVQLAEFCETIIYREPDKLNLNAPEAADVKDDYETNDTEQDDVKSIDSKASTIDENSPDNYIYTLPYLTDDAVLVTRLGEDITITKEINEGNSDKIYAGYPGDNIFRTWLSESHFNNIEEVSTNIADALELVLDNEADFTILPYHVATAIITNTMLSPRLTMSRTLFPIEYRFPILKDDIESFSKLNDELYKMEHDGTLVDIYYKNGIRPNIVIEQESKLLKPIILNVLLLFLCTLGIIYFTKYFSLYTKEKHKNDEKRYNEENDEFATITPAEKLSFLTEKNTIISEKIAENENTDPYSGFYNTQYLHQRINECFIQYAKNGRPFCIVLINATYRKEPFEQILKTMREEISNLFFDLGTDFDSTGTVIPNDIIAAHNGFGLFYILFPNATQDEALHAINRKNCRFQNFTLQEYKGQDQYEFLGGLSL